MGVTGEVICVRYRHFRKKRPQCGNVTVYKTGKKSDRKVGIFAGAPGFYKDGHVALTTIEARAMAGALLRFADEADADVAEHEAMVDPHCCGGNGATPNCHCQDCPDGKGGKPYVRIPPEQAVHRV